MQYKIYCSVCKDKLETTYTTYKSAFYNAESHRRSYKMVFEENDHHTSIQTINKVGLVT